MAAEPKCQLKSLVRGFLHGQGVKVGTIIWRTEPDARHLIENRLAAVIVAPAPVTEPVEVPEKKFLAHAPGWPLDRFSRIERAWEGRRVVCIASGPSLTPEQLEVVRRAREADRCRVIVINTSFLRAPWADVLYFADARWWAWFTRGKETSEQDKAAFKAFAGQKCTIWTSGNAVSDPAVHMLRIFDGPGALSNDPAALATCSNGGHQVVNMAALAAPALIALLGYDAQPGPGGRKHHHADHPDKSEAPYQAMLAYFPKLAAELSRAGIKTVNCSPGSALKCFPVGRIEDVLA